MWTDQYTGRQLDRPSSRASRLPAENGQTCGECGTKLIDRCYRCGAPVCCPRCCEDAAKEAKG